MQGLILLALSFIATFIISRTTNLKPLTNYKDYNEYLPILTSNIYADLLIILITFSGILGSGKSWQVLTRWYKKYRLSAMIADILIGVIYLLIARYIAYKQKLNLTLFQFGVLSVLVQIFFDFLFYIFFSLVPKGSNNMLDLFKDWSKFAKADALWGDSILVLVGVVLSAYLNQQTLNTNLFVLILGMYLVPYIIYMKD
jgi:uncharacterized protein YacL|tara:strand:- start:1696 stop:2292 length:597 start_codon:yes stop_codon:yes gene_type:complete